MKKRYGRHDAIRELVRNERIRTQDELVEKLQSKGFPCTQATISRDIAELDLQKLPEGMYVLSEDLHVQRMVNDLVVEVVRSGNLVLVKASPGSAAAVAAALDGAKMPGVLGSIAGDDTVLVLGDGEEGAKQFEGAIEDLRFK